MREDGMELIAEVLPALVGALEGLALLARHLDPGDVGDVLDQVGRPEAALPALRPRLDGITDELANVRNRLVAATEAVLAAYAGIRSAVEGAGDLRQVMRALRYAPLAQEALYPLCAAVPMVSHFFLNARGREDADLLWRLDAIGTPADTGLLQAGEVAAERGGFGLYVPETYDPARPMPLVMALHGGSGNGRLFLWSWLRDARSLGAILVAPTSIGPTWALMGEDADTPNLLQILAAVRARWAVDPERLLLTGLSDGGTFCYVSGLRADSPFTHLAPVAGTFHPLLAQAADRDRLRGLPICITHGVRDWMFPVEIARGASRALQAQGAATTYREIEDLSHTYPREINAELLAWLARPRS